ncbi:hypothetical protein AMECASPLE_015853 [Ameca splendens]|uniref:Secreted protein n=1 Tax=Ameca splendens TaxID=208324 RepID=A0ABV0XF30_9TELE
MRKHNYFLTLTCLLVSHTYFVHTHTGSGGQLSINANMIMSGKRQSLSQILPKPSIPFLSSPLHSPLITPSRKHHSQTVFRYSSFFSQGEHKIINHIPNGAPG